MGRITKKISGRLITLLITAVLVFLGYSAKTAYDNYTNLVVEQRQQHLLITARAVSQNLALYFDEQIRDIEILTRTPGFLKQFEPYYESGDASGLKEYIFSYMLAQHQAAVRIYLLDRDGETIYRYNKYPFIEEFDESRLHLKEYAARRQTGLGTVFRINDEHYGVTVINEVIDGNDLIGTAVAVYDMEELYEQFVASLNVDNICEIVVKNDKGTVIMSPVRAMLTFNYYRQIEDLATLPQYEGLNEMLTRQYSTEEGSAVYMAFSNGIIPAREEVTSFSRMNVGGTTWYVSASVPYSEVRSIVDSNLGRMGALLAAIFIIIALSILAVMIMQKNWQKLQLEAAYLRDINRTLEELHQSREKVIHYQKLQTLGALAGGIVHEFNNLLTPILGYSEFLKAQMGPESEYYEDIDEIYKAGSRAKEIVEQILPFSRKETDSSKYTLMSVDAVVRDSLKMLRMVTPSAIDIKSELEDDHARVYGSTTQISQVLLNLYTNACQSMADGGTLTVRTHLTAARELPENFLDAKEREYIVIAVEDTGCGISPDALPHIFDAFYTTKEIGEGTGLGLSVVQNILISHGGYIDAASTVGKGSCFTVYLPVADMDTEVRYEEDNAGYQ
jgi:two-component system, cell cycle sensor histidine kinase and response regulator CckA